MEITIEGVPLVGGNAGFRSTFYLRPGDELQVVVNDLTMGDL